MKKTCEFCGAPGPVVYCQADAALLCLSCDAKVHSANALFGRHSRSLLCDSCKEHSASVRCLDHLLLLCQQCNSRLHKSFSHHKKLMIGSFTGCPSVKQFADLLGFDVNDLHQLSTVESATSTASLDTRRASCSQQHKKLINYQREQNNNGLIIHQLLDLKNLQLTEGNNQTKSLHQNGEYVTSSSMHTTSGILLNESLLEQQSKEFNNISNELQSLDRSNQVLNGEHFPSPMSQLDISSSSVADLFWQQNKSPVDNDQFWSQNLQDLGTCQELGCVDDFNIPDVDATFRNFEDLLTGDPDLTRALVEVDDPMSSDSEKASMNKLKKSLVETTQSSDHFTFGISRSVDNSPHPARYSRSATFSCSRLSAENCSSDFLDIGNSGNFRSESSNNVVEELHGVELEGGENSIRSSKDKRKTRMHGKKTQLAPRKARTDLLKKNKRWYEKLQGYESDTATVTKSC